MTDEDVKALLESHAELERALSWAIPLAVVAMEDHRITRLRNGHSDIKAVRPDGTAIIGLWQDEQDEINHADAARARALRERIENG